MAGLQLGEVIEEIRRVQAFEQVARSATLDRFE